MGRLFGCYDRIFTSVVFSDVGGMSVTQFIAVGHITTHMDLQQLTGRNETNAKMIKREGEGEGGRRKGMCR